MSNDHFNLPSFTFPNSGPSLPPDPSPDIPLKPSDYKKLDLQWYLQYAISNATFHPRSQFGTLEASMRTRDLLEPRWTTTEPDYMGGGSLNVYCAVCKYPESAQATTNDEMWRACDYDNDNDRLNAQIVRDTQYILDEGGRGATIAVPQPYIPRNTTVDQQYRGSTDRAMACLAALRLNANLNLERSENSVVMSQLFLVQDTPHGDASASFLSAEYVPWVYNWTSPLGMPSVTDSTTTTETATPSVTPTCSGSGRYKSCVGDGGWNGMPIGKRVGILFGGIAGFIVLMLILWCCCGRGRCANAREGRERRERPRPMLLSELRAQQQREEEERAARERRSSGVSRAERDAHANAAGGEGDKPPPAYHEVVNDQERMLATYAMQRNSQAPAPSYQPSVGTSPAPPPTSESITQPAAALPSYPPPSDR
ncbi:Nn.00g083900.m01.CDS01 [Neocucurbitaria sp. VM-36]